jgi:chemotaxis-related protein WspB
VLIILFDLGEQHFAIKANDIQKIIHLVNFTSIPQAPHYVAGLFEHHGTLIPVVDLKQLIYKKPSEKYRSTRIFLCHYQFNQQTYTLGMIGEKMTETLKKSPEELMELGMKFQEDQLITEIINHNDGIIHCLNIQHLMNNDLKQILMNTEKKTPLI